MLGLFSQYIKLLYEIRISKIQGYKALQVNSIYPANQVKLKKKGYSIYEPNIFQDYYTIIWL